MFVGLIIYEIRPFTNFERGVAALIWSLPISVFLTMILVYLDTPYIFLSLFGVPGFSGLLLPPGKFWLWRVLGGVLLALSVFITLVTSGVIEQ
ncbi:MAG TPA: hypothetical protein VFE21_00035 [Rubrobacteraceae bacterium]|nr:hypothetical protein [Rubrobacteraceae bacterium]